MCGVDQHSPGAYFLRKGIFSALSTFITSPETERFVFEAVLFLSILSNFHHSEALKLNPVVICMKNISDKSFLRKVCWATKFALEMAIRYDRYLAS